MLAPWKKSYDQPRQHIKKQRHYFASKGLSSQSYSFSSSHVWMWELDYKESWARKNWCFWIVLEKILESPRRFNQSILKEISPEYSLEGLTLKLNSNTLAIWCEELTHWKRLCCWEGLGAGGEGDDIGWWHHRLNAHESEWTPRVGDGQGNLVCCSLWGCKELSMTEPLRNNHSN